MDLSWYQTLVKPPLTPPSWLFGPVWTVLYLLMASAAILIWRAGWRRREVKKALAIFALQLFLNLIWSPLFFGLHNISAALVDIIFLWLTIVWTIIAAAKVSKPAAWLLAPYLLWVTFATYLNLALWWLN